MNKGYVIFNQDLTKEQLQIAEYDGRLYYPINKFTLKMEDCRQKHYLIIQKMLNDLFPNVADSYDVIEQYLTDLGTILVLNDDYSFSSYGEKITEVRLPINLDLISENQLQTLKELYQQWQAFDKIYLINQLPDELSYLTISSYKDYNKEQNLDVIREYIDVVEQRVGEKQKRGK